jgi:hypothetical protein
MLRPHRFPRLTVALALLTAATACGGGDATLAPTTGTLEITTSTSGTEQDADGYSVQMDGGAARAIGPAATLTTSEVTAGNHTLQLGEVAANCTVSGDNPRTINITAGETTTINFAVTCGATTESMRITTATTGSSLDRDGYTLSIDGGAARATGINEVLIVPAITRGDHTVALAGLASNCTTDGPNPRTVTITAGVEASVSFTVICTYAGATRWATIPFPANFYAGALWASSPSDLFVTGTDRSDPLHLGLVLHYDGHQWTEQFRGSGSGSPSALWGSSPTNVFGVGGETIWHYDGSHWLPVHSGDHAVYRAIWGASTHLFAVGWLEGLKTEGLVDHYDGATWRPPEVAINAWGDIYDVSGTSPNDVFIVGSQIPPYGVPIGTPDFFHIVLHYDGSTWSESFHIYEDHEVGSLMTAVWASAGNDVFVVGLHGNIWHFDGSVWSPMTSPTSEHLLDVWASSGSDVYAVGDGGILRYNGSIWTVINPTPALRVWGAGTDVFVLTRAGILHGTP